MSATKVMLTIFWDASDVLYTRGRQSGGPYCATLRSFKQRVLRIRRERNVFLLHHDNDRSHCNDQTQDVGGKLKFTVVPQSSYSPDLSPSDFRLFSELKKTMEGQRFSMDAEVQAAVRTQLTRIFLYRQNEEMDRTVG
ncbi:hypothetical protein TNCV_2874851 [Trichonephila clavipes]|nr:hypothetical protein TNCV_2874851 [Trichonephila clavipes]